MRRIVSLAGHSAQFAVADDGTCWFWNGAGWEPARGPLPQPMVANDVAAPRVVMATITTGEVGRAMDGNSPYTQFHDAKAAAQRIIDSHDPGEITTGKVSDKFRTTARDILERQKAKKKP